jgi:hypothetical protein
VAIGITEEHEALRQAVRGWAERHCDPSVPRALLDADAEALPPFWEELAAQGWLGLHVDEALGGEGYGLPELAVVLEELGRHADVIILDSPPLTEFADAFALADAVDVVLIAVRLGRTRRDRFMELRRFLAQHGVSAAGFVVTARRRSRGTRSSLAEEREPEVPVPSRIVIARGFSASARNKG